MRIRIKNPKAFFKEIKGEKSLKLFSKEIGINYNNIKRWYRGENTIDENSFNILINKQTNKLRCLKLNKNFCEFYGALMGDGCLTSYKRRDGTIFLYYYN